MDSLVQNTSAWKWSLAWTWSNTTQQYIGNASKVNSAAITSNLSRSLSTCLLVSKLPKRNRWEAGPVDCARDKRLRNCSPNHWRRGEVCGTSAPYQRTREGSWLIQTSASIEC